ncbi:MAG: tetratricopeptide repeat protein [Oscillospiraceae bacterium]|nr:tetratricopeptide repeat protein [Oscillospiraceae bacterium]
MKKLASLILAILLTLTLFTSCAEPAEALTSVYLNLGEKYLTDLNYEEAIVYFNKVIEVEPKNARAYLGSAEAYVAMGDVDSAIAVLEQGIEVVNDPTELQAMLSELLEESEAETQDEVPEDEAVQEELEEEQEEESSEITAEDIGAAINEASLFAWNWFWDNQHTDKTDTIWAPYDGDYYTYERVSEEGITTLDDVRILTQQYFTADAAEELINVKEWIERDGVLYVSATEGLGGIGPPDYYEITVKKLNDTSYKVYLDECYEEIGIFSSTFTYSYVNGYWVFDTALSCESEVPVTLITVMEDTDAEPLYDDDELTVSGILTDRYYELNSDNYGTVYILVLDEPITRSLYSDVAGYDGEVMEIDEIQLILPYTESYIRSNLLGEHLELAGTVMYGHTGHHLTTILLDVE